MSTIADGGIGMKKYVLAGAGSRGAYMFAKPLVNEFKSFGCLAGIFDTNMGRAADLSYECGNVPVYEDFDRMLETVRPDTVIIAAVDRWHHEYAIKALEAGCDVIVEKPMTIDALKCKVILEAEKRTGKKVTVTFNYRFVPYVTRVKELIREGAVGTVLNVDFEWYLDTSHGAGYFRRWHRKLENSGGLLVHKSTHHFDLVNWWLEDEPSEVYAFGDLRFYGPVRQERGERCSTCSYTGSCEFYYDLAADSVCNKLYMQHEGKDGYYRDRCVFSEEIDIYDTMSLNVRYNKGTCMSYSLVAYSPYEGWRASITGTKGRMELEEIHSGIYSGEAPQKILLYDMKGERIAYEIGKATGSHGGGDARLQRMLFVGDVPDPLGHQADSTSGAMSVLIGAAANRSIVSGKPVKIKELLDRG